VRGRGQITPYNESPVYMMMNPLIAPNSKDLPVTLYESGAQSLRPCGRTNSLRRRRDEHFHAPATAEERGEWERWWGAGHAEMHVIDGVPSMIFVKASYTIETVEAERISVDQIARILPGAGGVASASQRAPRALPVPPPPVCPLGVSPRCAQLLSRR
jgi:COP9 signalosome complex subunit 6